MKIKDVKLVVADIDGTIQVTGAPMSRRNIEAIEQLHRRGILFGLSSGKNLFDISRFSQTWGFSFDFDVLIGMNGAELWDNIHQKRYEFDMLSPKDLKDIFEYVQPLNLNPFIYYKDGMMMMHEDAEANMSSARNRMKLYFAKDISEMYQQPNAKVLLRTPKDFMATVEQYCNEHPRPNFRHVKSQPTMMEFINPNTSKANGLKVFCQLNDISLDNVLAFGDNSNDVEMLQCCYGICLADGSPDCKAAAKEVTRLDCRSDGFADWLEENLFK